MLWTAASAGSRFLHRSAASDSALMRNQLRKSSLIHNTLSTSLRNHPVRQSIRALAAARKSPRENHPDEKTWGEVAEEAASGLKAVVDKTVSVVKRAIGQDEASKVEKRDRRETEELSRPPDFGSFFGGGLLGRAAGSVLGSAVRAMGEQMAEVSRQSEGVQRRAAMAIQSSREVSDRLGGAVEVGTPVSQSSMSSSINGRVSKKVTLVLPVSGPRGLAQAQVESIEGGDDPNGLQIWVGPG
uniref:Uncharacterized protein n=1 Tax=Tetraselmis sp. GSL018 TaxID=582737 RepID=A0A061REU6_9CHLO